VSTTRLLIVDDDPAQRGMLLDLLGDAADRVTAAADGEEALARLEETGADLMLVDMRMPRMGGLGVLE
jgi:CheY-like chemotaxis protein